MSFAHRSEYTEEPQTGGPGKPEEITTQADAAARLEIAKKQIVDATGFKSIVQNQLEVEIIKEELQQTVDRIVAIQQEIKTYAETLSGIDKILLLREVNALEKQLFEIVGDDGTIDISDFGDLQSQESGYLKYKPQELTLVRFLDEATQGNALYQKLFTEGKMMPLNEYISYKAKSDNMPTNKAIIDYYDTVNTLTNIAQVAPHTFDTYFKNAQFNSGKRTGIDAEYKKFKQLIKKEFLEGSGNKYKAEITRDDICLGYADANGMPYLCDRVREVATKNGNKLVMNAFQSIGDLPGLIEKSSGGGGATTYYYVTLGKNDTIEKTEILMASSEKMGEILELVKKNPDQVRNKESFGKSVGVVATGIKDTIIALGTMYASTLGFAALIQGKPNEFLRAPSGTGGGTRNNNQTGSSTGNGTQGQESTTTESSQTVELSLTEWQGKIDQASEALKTQQQDFEKTQEVFEHLLVRGNPVKMDFKDMTAVEIADAIKNAEGQYVSEAFVEISDTNKVFANYLMMEEISLLTAINKLGGIDNVEAEADVAKKLIYLATAIDVTIS